MKKKILFAFFVIIIATMLFIITSSAASVLRTWDISATSSDNVTATLYDDGSMVISGTGNMKDWDYEWGTAPWISFYNLDISNLTIENGVVNIGNCAFYNCRNLRNVEIPDSTIIVGSNAFSSCSSLISIEIPNSITSIGDNAFYLCTNLTSAEIGDCVTSIGVCAFSYCTSLISVKIPASVISIGNNAFSNCENLTSILIGDCITSIGNNAFNGCSSLISIVIPNSVTMIGAYAFYRCTNLTIYCEAESQPSGWDSDWNSDNRPVVWGHTHTYENDKCVCGKEKPYVELWDISATSSDNVTATLYNDYSLVISGTGNMKDWNYNGAPWYSSYNSKIASVTIENGVTSIGSSAFSGCDFLTSVVIPDSVTSIGSDAFSRCYFLTSVVIPDSVTLISAGAFYECWSLKSVVIPESVKSIDDFAFAWCWSLTSVVIPESVTSIGDVAFEYCTSLTSIEIPNSVTTIGYGAFYGCEALTSIVIPDSVTTIGSSAFSSCYSLTIYCEAESQPSTWNSDWNPDNRPVAWGYGLDDIIIFKGYSIREDGTGAICAGYTINYEKLAKYEELTGKKLDYGIVFAGYANLKGKQPLNSDGTAITLEEGKVINQSLVRLYEEKQYTSYDFIIDNISEEKQSVSFVIAMYLYDGEAVKYCTSYGVSDIVYGISFNEIKYVNGYDPEGPPDEPLLDDEL